MNLSEIKSLDQFKELFECGEYRSASVYKPSDAAIEALYEQVVIGKDYRFDMTFSELYWTLRHYDSFEAIKEYGDGYFFRHTSLGGYKTKDSIMHHMLWKNGYGLCEYDGGVLSYLIEPKNN